MQPKIEYRKAFTLLGLQETFEQDKEDFEGIWNRYMTYHDQIAPHSVDGAHYGANFASENPKALTYVAGMAVTGIDAAPEGLTLRTIPASRYAIFECAVATIGETYDRIFGEWLLTAPYPRPGPDSPKADFERYPPGTDSGDTPVRLHIALDEVPG